MHVYTHYVYNILNITFREVEMDYSKCFKYHQPQEGRKRKIGTTTTKKKQREPIFKDIIK